MNDTTAIAALPAATIHQEGEDHNNRQNEEDNKGCYHDGGGLSREESRTCDDSNEIQNDVDQKQEEGMRLLVVMWEDDNTNAKFMSSDYHLARVLLSEEDDNEKVNNTTSDQACSAGGSPQPAASNHHHHHPLNAIRDLRLLGYPQETLPNKLTAMPGLRSLTILDSSTLTSIDDDSSIAQAFPRLESLTISNCVNLQTLSCVGRFEKLRFLELNFCPNLRAIPAKIGRLHNLKSLHISDCGRLETLPPEIGELHNLEAFQMTTCSRLTSFPPEFCNLTNLKSLNFDHLASRVFLSTLVPNLKRLLNLQSFESKLWWDTGIPQGLFELESLQELTLTSAMRVFHIPESFSNLRNLRKLSLKYFKLRQTSPQQSDEDRDDDDDGNDGDILSNLRRLPSLESLHLYGFEPSVIVHFFKKNQPWKREGGEPSSFSAVLKEIDLTYCMLGDDGCRQILPGLPDSLESLKLDYNGISTLDGLLVASKEGIQRSLPPQIRCLSLVGNPVLASQDTLQRNYLEQLLSENSHLSSICSPWTMDWREVELLTPALQCRLRFHEMGDKLLREAVVRDPWSISSLWPNVLERAAKNFEKGSDNHFVCHRSAKSPCRLTTSGCKSCGISGKEMELRDGGEGGRQSCPSCVGADEMVIQASILYTLLRMQPSLISKF